MITDTAPQLRHVEMAWRGYDKIAVANSQPKPALRWYQEEYRSTCGTGCCYAGHLALAAGSHWLVKIHNNQMTIDGTPVTKTDRRCVEHSIHQYMLATEDDPLPLIRLVRGKRVIHVRHQAAHLIGLNPYADNHDDGGLFAPGNSREDLARLITEQIGPRP
ncbi:hypothetical protein [Nonomuraea sp. NPDC023979]|uniref:hypothetical protein n=1 Tax=Nonomuraea sp. NPDC023979 TaxID=3154796 RepID=UPI0034021A7B